MSSVLFVFCLFVCLLACTVYNTEHIFTKAGGKAAHEPRKKPLDFGGDVYYVTLVLELGYGWS